jgi:hypothetical protein
MTGQSLIGELVHRHSRSVVVLLGLWFAFVFFYISAATNGAVFGLPLHLIGATFTFILVAILLMGRSSSRQETSSGAQSSGSEQVGVPGVDEITDTGGSIVDELGSLSDRRSDDQRRRDPRTTQPRRRTESRRNDPEQDTRDSGLDAITDTEIDYEE